MEYPEPQEVPDQMVLTARLDQPVCQDLVVVTEPVGNQDHPVLMEKMLKTEAQEKLEDLDPMDLLDYPALLVTQEPQVYPDLMENTEKPVQLEKPD